MIGAVDEGWWTGDGISSGLLRLAYPALANGVNEGDVEYTSLMYTLYVALTLLSTTILGRKMGGKLMTVIGSKTPR
jgi:hypothetical protein